MALVQTAMLSGMPYSKLREAIFAHPTMAEGLGFLLANVPTRSMQVGYSVSSCPSLTHLLNAHPTERRMSSSSSSSPARLVIK